MGAAQAMDIHFDGFDLADALGDADDQRGKLFKPIMHHTVPLLVKLLSLQPFCCIVNDFRCFVNKNCCKINQHFSQKN